MTIKLLGCGESPFGKQCLSPGHQHYVEPRRCDLLREFLPDSRRSASDEGPRSESPLINLCHHCVPPLLFSISSVLIHSLSRTASIATNSGSLAACATAAIP